VVALLATALWLLHPLQTEAVDYLIQRTELIMALCYLATLYCSIRAWDASTPAAWFVAGSFACLLGMASKEVMVSAPLMIVLYDRAFRVRSWRELARAQRGRLLFYVALAATVLLLAGLLASNPRGTTVGFNALPWYEYLHTQGWAIAHYLRLALLPTGFSFDYDYHPVAHWRGIPGLFLLVALGTITILAWTRANRWGWLGFLGAWFFLILAPSSSVVPILTELVAERRMYLPSIAVLIALLIAVGAGWRAFGPARLAGRRMAWVASSVVILLLAMLTWRRSTLYANPEALWRDTAREMPADPRAWNNLGSVVGGYSAERADEAESFYRTAVQLDSGYVDALLNLGMSELRRRDSKDAEPGFRRILALDSTNHFASGGLANILLDRGDTVAALPLMERFAVGGAGVDFLVRLGQIYLAAGRGAEGADALRRAVQQAPSRIDLLTFLGDVLIEQKHADQAAPYLQMAVDQAPDGSLSRALLALADAGMGRLDDAMKNAERAMQHAGNDEPVFFFAGRAMLDVHQDTLAENYLSRAVSLQPRDADAITLLGEVKANLGKKGEAVELFNRALAIDPRIPAARAGLARLRR
jgi:tetratricopeptide (TPR) repeat protein